MLDDNIWLSLASALIAVVVVIGLAYWFTRCIAGRSPGFSMSRNCQLKLLEQLPVGKEQRLAVVQAAQRCFLLGITASSISVLAELTPEEAALWQQTPDVSPPPDFKQAFINILQNRKQR